MKKFLSVICLALLMAVSGWAKEQDKELDTVLSITSDRMKKELTEGRNSNVYVRAQNGEKVVVYRDTSNSESYGKLLILNLVPDEVTYIYTNEKKIYKDLYSRLRFYAGRYYDFNGYRLITENEGAKEIGGMRVYRIWVMKVLRPKELVEQHDICYSSSHSYSHPGIVIDVFGGPWKQSKRPPYHPKNSECK